MSAVSASKRTDATQGDMPDIQQVAALFGGKTILKCEVWSAFEAHALILGGLPAAALSHLIDHLRIVGSTPSLEKALGVSLRTLQRQKESPEKKLSKDQGGRAWKFAEILATATAVFGSQDEAEFWLTRPAIGLEQHCPIDLLATPTGLKLVEDFLERLRFGVYA
ncbi:antitoxin Xre/MbcA/ParS toxin-binding domain-containing protein [Beijerinckia sp. L45]|uniref:type II RES/Xre toxin-antitoxin system antitoxin n=1 Tax=Beijerinckia sp. L45 TaxID=1641855 RepID=UPI001FEEA45F|nr:antitoxin Xre/MbcA/ParS toxin-binding domain-containing protein [Beijerinckia sp. L45]